MRVWQGDTPDSGGAATMGVPLPHLVLPLSGCLSRHTPTRATRGEARGHRSVLAQNPFVDAPPFFFFPCTCRRSGVSSPDGGLVPNVIALLRLHSCLVSPDGFTLWTCGSPKDSQHDGPGSVCCLCGNRGRRAHNGFPLRIGEAWG